MCKRELCGVQTKLGMFQVRGLVIPLSLKFQPIPQLGSFSVVSWGGAKIPSLRSMPMASGLRLEIPLCLPAAQVGLFLLLGSARGH